MAKTYVYDLTFKQQSTEVQLDSEQPFMYNVDMDGNKVSNIKYLAIVKQFIDDMINSELSPPDPPKSVLSTC